MKSVVACAIIAVVKDKILKQEVLMNGIDYTAELKYHYRPKKGWINDPNGLVYFKGYYHIFYQHAPDFEIPWKQPMHWGHARTKDFLEWEELPVALTPGDSYDGGGCWSGTAIVKDERLYLFYAAITAVSTVAVAVSDDGINFEKYCGNPVIDGYPSDGGPDFRDPAVCCIDGEYYCIVASGNVESKTGRLLLYKSADLLEWDYIGIMREWGNCKYTECPSFAEVTDGKCLLAASVCPLDSEHYFQLMYGSFKDGRFFEESVSEIDKGPDQYAGQTFRDHLGRNLLITWIPGWKYSGFAEKNIGCMSVPREIRVENGRITAFPIEEVRHLLTESDSAVKRTETGFIIERNGRTPVVYNGKLDRLDILRDGCIVEVFVNGGESVYSALL